MNMNNCSTFLYHNKEIDEKKEVISVWTFGMLGCVAGPSRRT